MKRLILFIMIVGIIGCKPKKYCWTCEVYTAYGKPVDSAAYDFFDVCGKTQDDINIIQAQGKIRDTVLINGDKVFRDQRTDCTR